MKKKILIADDSSTIRKFVKLTLKFNGYDVITAVDGMEAFEKIPQTGVDLIITDLNMPIMDGYEYIKNIRDDEKFKKIPIIILSSESEQKDIDKGLALGANSYVTKPFDADKLISAIKVYLK